MIWCRADTVGLLWGGAIAASALALGPSPLSLGLPTLGLGLTLADGVFRKTSSVLVPTITRGPTQTGRVALTFDDGPDPERTPRIARALAKAGHTATFFCVGEKLDRYPAVAHELLSLGHELANHSYHHRAATLNFRGPKAMDAEIAAGARAVQRVTNSADEPLYRPPVGLKSPPLSRVARHRRLRVVCWSLHSRDTFARDPAQVAARVTRRLRPGDIVLLHDPRPGTADAVDLILESMAARSLTSVSVSAFLAGR